MSALVVVRLAFDVPEIGGRRGDVLSLDPSTGHLCVVRPLDDNPLAWSLLHQLCPGAGYSSPPRGYAAPMPPAAGVH